MKKMTKMYEAPMAEVVELNLNKDFMQGGWNTGSAVLGPEEDL